MEKEIFDYNNYKRYLNDWIDGQPARGRGLRAEIAKQVGCQRAFVSQVLGGHAHFSLEHAARLNHFLGHGEMEAEFFLFLLERDRAGNDELRQFFERRLQELVEKRSLLRTQLQAKEQLEKTDQSTYYSSWDYGAVHMAVTIPEFQTKEQIVKRLAIPISRVAEILDFLTATGLVEQRGDRFAPSEKNIHVGADSAFVLQHHLNWRLRTIMEFNRRRETSLHYTSAMSMSRKDCREIKTWLMKRIQELRKRVEESKEETLVSFNMDFFEI